MHKHHWRFIEFLLPIGALLAPFPRYTRAMSPVAFGDVFQIQALDQSDSSSTPESELQHGIALTQRGRFSDAIPHLLAARGHVSDEYAANFDLALCYVSTAQFDEAIRILGPMKITGYATAGVNNLLAQAYIGKGQDKEAFSAFQQAVMQTPLDEKLYLLVSEACMDHQSYDLGLEVLNIGLQHLPNSSRLHYERGVFFSFENEPDSAAFDFGLASKLGAGTDISYMASGQKALMEGDPSEAVRITREGIRKGHNNYILLAIFGNAVVHSGASPDQPEFREAEAALVKSVAERPNYSVSQAALGELYLMEGRTDEAISSLQAARNLTPQDASIYSHLAVAYRRNGNLQEAQRTLTILATLNQKQAAKYKSDSPSHKAGYVSSGRPPQQP
ncbi:MAG TPA: tetratricopeptide repeat protein [Candidatus Acidoferrales bacterium]|nr:tetratricopeptide repeat protein [Candidatus Acidoferrales bacterium]